MNFFITTASLLNEVTISHLSRCGYNAIFSELINSIIFEGLVVNTYEHHDDIEHIHIWDGAVSICSTSSKELIANASVEAESVLMEYTKFNFNRNSDSLPYSLQHSCVLYDVEMNQLQITSDSVGSIPIWYSIQKNDLMVSTDYLGLYYSGHMYPNALGPGQRMVIDLKSKEIISISHSLSESAMVNKEHSIDYIEVSEVYARNVFVQSIQAIDIAINNDPSWRQLNSSINDDILFTMELDLMEPSSILLDCIADSMKLNRAIRRTRPLVVDDIYTDQFPILSNILNAIPESFIHAPVSSARDISFKRIAIDRWNLCLSASIGPLKLLVSFELGLTTRPIHIYFQNLFCYLLDVTIIYPFHTNELQKAIWSNIYPKSYLYDAVAILQTDTTTTSAMCHSIDSFEDKGSVRTWTMNDLIPCTTTTIITTTQESYCIDQQFHYVQQPYDNNMNYYKNYFTSENISIVYNSIISSTYHQMNTHSHSTKMKEVYINKQRNSFLDLWHEARKFINKDRIIILLLATSDYKDLLTNFLCSIKSIDIKNILIITQDDNIKAIASTFEVGYYSPALHINSLQSADFGTITYQQLVLSRTECALELLLMGIHPIIADIDTVWKSNPLDHIPWSSTYSLKTSSASSEKNILEHQQQVFDIAIVDDSGEVCGCFVALHYQENTIKFWRQVVMLHRELIVQSIKHPYMYKFDDSEQKILTDLIYKSKYQGGILKVTTLPSMYFPSGFVYFSTHSFNPLRLSSSSMPLITSNDMMNNTIIPAIIHNNFIIGRELKQTRFQRYGLWNINPLHSMDRDTSTNSYNSNQFNTCMLDKTNHIYNNWEKIFLNIQQDVYMPSISINTPIHNSILDNQTNELMLFISIEGPLYKENISKQLNISKNYKLDFIATQLQVSSDPPKYISSSPFLITKYNLSHSHSHSNDINDHRLNSKIETIRSFTLITNDPKISISIDVSLENRQHFGIDRKNLYYIKAMEHVLYNQRLYKEQYKEHIDNDNEVTYDGTIQQPLINSSIKVKKIPYLDNIPKNTNQLEKEMHEIRTMNDLNDIIYKIIVITYNRSNSLYRLLQSLSNAYYMNHTNIDLYIYIDGYKSILDKEHVLNCKLIADTFIWKYGMKYVQLRDNNIGLVGQWFNAWSPQNESEVAFIFEDDIEVSPYYFKWAFKATEKYYQYDYNQRYLHKQLLDSIQQEVIANGTKQEYIDMIDQIETILYQSPLERFTHLTAGKPIIYGICLQKQSLDPHHYPRKLQIKNGYRPYLYSLIGSWGPVMLPNIWNAFKTWWEWKYKISQNNNHDNNKQGWYDINTEDIVTNYFYSNNKNIWTPWHIRFAYETATKCLYSNLPDDYALIINHREQGENYVESIGPDHRLINKDDLQNIPEQSYNINSSNSNNRSRVLVDKEVYLLSYQPSSEVLLSWSYHTLPSISFLSLWQFDFNVRRVGSIFSDAAFIVPITSNDSNSNNDHQDNNSPELKLKYDEVDMIILHASNDLAHQKIVLNRQHWLYILEIIQSHLLPSSKILHLGRIIDPIYYLTSMHDFYQHYVYTIDRNISIGEHINHSTNHIEHISDFESLQDPRFSIVIIDLQYLIQSMTAYEINKNISELIWNYILPVEYILVFDVCSSAPTDFSIEFEQNIPPNHRTLLNLSSHYHMNKVNYSIVEDICLIGNEIYDKGAVLYSISKGHSTKSHSHHRFALSRRIERSLQTRRIVDGSSII